MRISTQVRTAVQPRPFRSSDLITPKDSGTKGKTIVMLTTLRLGRDEFEYVSFYSPTGASVWVGTPHKFTTDEWELFEGELVLSN